MEKIEISKSGIPCMWEKGGGMSSIGHATIIADSVGGPKRPIFVRKKGELSCGEHALIPVVTGDYVVFAGHQRCDTVVKIHRIADVSIVLGEVPGEVIDEFYHDQAEDVFMEKYGLSYDELEPTRIDTKRPCRKMGDLLVYHQFSDWFYIRKIEKAQFAYADTELLERFKTDRSEIIKAIPEKYGFLAKAIEKAIAKAFCYHCTRPFYIIERGRKI